VAVRGEPRSGGEPSLQRSKLGLGPVARRRNLAEFLEERQGFAGARRAWPCVAV